MKRLLIFALLLLALAYAGQWLWRSPLYGLRLALRDPPLFLNLPVAGVQARMLSDTWGAAREGGREHEGIDIFARRGTPVLASTEGLVWKTGETERGGIVVWVLGPGREMHYYAHLAAIADISSGDRVRAGDLLGFVGNTGNARTTPPHLHYGIYTMKGAINPYPRLILLGPLETTLLRFSAVAG